MLVEETIPWCACCRYNDQNDYVTCFKVDILSDLIIALAISSLVHLNY